MNEKTPAETEIKEINNNNNNIDSLISVHPWYGSSPDVKVKMRKLT